MLHNPVIRYVCVLAALVLSLCLAYMAKDLRDIYFEGPIRNLWLVPAAFWTVGFAYLCVQTWIAKLWILARCLNALIKLTATWPKILKDILVILSIGLIRI